MYKSKRKVNKDRLMILILSILVIALSIVGVWTVEDKAKMQIDYEHELNTLNKENIKLNNQLNIITDEYNEGN